MLVQVFRLEFHLCVYPLARNWLDDTACKRHTGTIGAAAGAFYFVSRFLSNFFFYYCFSRFVYMRDPYGSIRKTPAVILYVGRRNVSGYTARSNGAEDHDSHKRVRCRSRYQNNKRAYRTTYCVVVVVVSFPFPGAPHRRRPTMARPRATFYVFIRSLFARV